jgi:hypothetical protein
MLQLEELDIETERSAFNESGTIFTRSAQFFLNAAILLLKTLEVYAFGGTSPRTGQAAGFTEDQINREPILLCTQMVS